jgi:hypothetical protein
MTGSALRDPIYQLNFVLWMLEELPPAAPTRPFLRQMGYTLHSLGGSLPMPPELRVRLADLNLEARQAPAPDVLASRRGSTEFLVVECKAASFGAGSSTAHQARALLVVSADLRGPLGLPALPEISGVVSYLLPEPDSTALEATVHELAQELEGARLPTAPFAVLGFEERSDGVYLLDRHPPTGLPPDVEESISDGVRIHEVFEGETGRRLYLIPWDPSVSQTPEERQFCQRILFERVLAEALALAGRAPAPGEVHLPMDILLDRATFTLARRWRARQDIKHITQTIHRFLRGTIERHPRKFATRWDAMTRTLVVSLGSAEEHGDLLRALEEGQPAEWLKGRDMQQPELFEDEGER